MRRRCLALWLALAACGAADAQTPDRTYRLGVLASNPTAIESMRAITLPELATLGFTEGRNLVVDVRFGEAAYVETMARHLVEARPDALIGIGPLAIAALRDATATVPIVMSLGPDDPRAHGFSDSLARPTRNITGLIALSTELDGKRLQLLKETIPTIRRIAVFLAPYVRGDPIAMRETAQGLGLEFVGARSFHTRYEYSAALAEVRRAGAEALMIESAPLFADDPVDLVRMATEAGMPTICEWRGLVERGCLIGYGPSVSELRRRTADYVARLFGGKSPSELPIEGPTHFELTMNLRTAGALGVTIAPTLLARADEVIE
jgi:putative tryptophan/tyrosine transport system substrate-binding protein